MRNQKNARPPITVVMSASAILLLGVAGNVQGQYVYTPLSVPGSDGFTAAHGISGNTVVGWYDNGSSDQGFLYNTENTTYTTFSVPGASDTFAWGIFGNNIVGYCAIGGSDDGFWYNGSSYVTFSAPGAIQTLAYGMSGNNIVGTLYTTNGDNEGFEYNVSSGSFTYLNVPGAVNTIVDGISGNNIVGFYLPQSGGASFLYNGTSYTSFNDPAGAGTSFAYGISENDIAGAYTSGSDTFGFLYNGSSYTSLSVPGTTSTWAFGVSGNDVVGEFIPDGNESDREGFLAVPAPEPSALAIGVAAFLTTLCLYRRKGSSSSSLACHSLTRWRVLEIQSDLFEKLRIIPGNREGI